MPQVPPRLNLDTHCRAIEGSHAIAHDPDMLKLQSELDYERQRVQAIWAAIAAVAGEDMVRQVSQEVNRRPIVASRRFRRGSAPTTAGGSMASTGSLSSRLSNTPSRAANTPRMSTTPRVVGTPRGLQQWPPVSDVVIAQRPDAPCGSKITLAAEAAGVQRTEIGGNVAECHAVAIPFASREVDISESLSKAHASSAITTGVEDMRIEVCSTSAVDDMAPVEACASVRAEAGDVAAGVAAHAVACRLFELPTAQNQSNGAGLHLPIDSVPSPLRRRCVLGDTVRPSSQPCVPASPTGSVSVTHARSLFESGTRKSLADGVPARSASSVELASPNGSGFADGGSVGLEWTRPASTSRIHASGIPLLKPSPVSVPHGRQERTSGSVRARVLELEMNTTRS